METKLDVKLQERIENIESSGLSLVEGIKSDEAYEVTLDITKQVKDVAKELKEQKEKFTKPMNESLKNIRDFFRPYEEKLVATEKDLKQKMSAYISEKERAAAAEQARLDAIREKANAKREEKHEEVIQTPVKQVEEVPKTVKTNIGSSTISKVWKHRIVSIEALPVNVKRAIFAEAYTRGLIDTVIKKFVDAGEREISGVEIYQDNQVNIR